MARVKQAFSSCSVFLLVSVIVLVGSLIGLSMASKGIERSLLLSVVSASAMAVAFLLVEMVVAAHTRPAVAATARRDQVSPGMAATIAGASAVAVGLVVVVAGAMGGDSLTSDLQSDMAGPATLALDDSTIDVAGAVQVPVEGSAPASPFARPDEAAAAIVVTAVPATARVVVSVDGEPAAVAYQGAELRVDDVGLERGVTVLVVADEGVAVGCVAAHGDRSAEAAGTGWTECRLD